MAQVFVGLDCGGSSTRLVAVDSDGNELFRGNAGPGNLASTPFDRVRRNIQLASHGCPHPDFVCGCFAGVVGEATRAKGEKVLHEAFPDSKLRVETDYGAALAANKCDVCVIAGTGSLISSRTKEGIVKSGGKGYILGDEGSAFRLGRLAMRFHTDDPTRTPDFMLEAIAKALGTDDPSEALTRVYQAGAPQTVLAKLAKPFVKWAAADTAARMALETEMQGLAEITAAHIRRHFTKTDAITIALAGGVWKTAPLVPKLFAEQVFQEQMAVPNASGCLEFFVSTRPSVMGAVQLAMEMSV